MNLVCVFGALKFGAYIFYSLVLHPTVAMLIDVHTLPTKSTTMLATIAIILVALWLLGLVTSYTLGGFIHILLVLAVVAVLVRLVQGRNPI